MLVFSYDNYTGLNVATHLAGFSGINLKSQDLCIRFLSTAINISVLTKTNVSIVNGSINCVMQNSTIHILNIFCPVFVYAFMYKSIAAILWGEEQRALLMLPFVSCCKDA